MYAQSNVGHLKCRNYFSSEINPHITPFVNQEMRKEPQNIEGQVPWILFAPSRNRRLENAGRSDRASVSPQSREGRENLEQNNTH